MVSYERRGMKCEAQRNVNVPPQWGAAHLPVSVKLYPVGRCFQKNGIKLVLKSDWIWAAWYKMEKVGVKGVYKACYFTQWVVSAWSILPGEQVEADTVVAFRLYINRQGIGGNSLYAGRWHQLDWLHGRHRPGLKGCSCAYCSTHCCRELIALR